MTTTKKTVSGKHFRSYSARIDGLISKSNSQAFYFPGPVRLNKTKNYNPKSQSVKYKFSSPKISTTHTTPKKSSRISAYIISTTTTKPVKENEIDRTNQLSTENKNAIETTTSKVQLAAQKHLHSNNKWRPEKHKIKLYSMPVVEANHNNEIFKAISTTPSGNISPSYNLSSSINTEEHEDSSKNKSPGNVSQNRTKLQLSSDSYEDSSMVVGNTDRLQKQFSLDSDENISIDYNRDGAFLRNKISSRHKRPLYAVGSKELREWFKENDFGVTNMSEMLVPIKSSGLVDDKINELENDSITKIKPLYTVTTRNQSNNPTNALSSEDYGEDTIRPFTTTIAPTPTTSLFQEVDGDLTDSQPNKIKIKPSYVQPDTLEMLISALEYAVTPLDSHGVQEDFQPENKANVLERDAAEQKEIFDSSIQNSNTLYNSETSLATSTTTVPPLTDVIFTQNNVDNGVEEDLLIALEYATAHPNSNDNNDVNKVQLDPEPVQTNIAYENAHEYEPYNNILTDSETIKESNDHQYNKQNLDSLVHMPDNQHISIDPIPELIPMSEQDISSYEIRPTTSENSYETRSTNDNYNNSYKVVDEFREQESATTEEPYKHIGKETRITDMIDENSVGNNENSNDKQESIVHENITQDSMPMPNVKYCTASSCVHTLKRNCQTECIPTTPDGIACPCDANVPTPTDCLNTQYCCCPIDNISICHLIGNQHVNACR